MTAGTGVLEIIELDEIPGFHEDDEPSFICGTNVQGNG
jgi:hypothetical protein